jgi:UDP-glucose:(heptosyl)LPS alpha-1,3-glucosyltransferase
LNQSKKRLKIGLAIDFVHKTGGTQRSTWEIAERLGKDHDVTILARTSSATGTENFRCLVIDGFWKKIPYVRNVIFAYQVSRVSRRLKFDILNVQGSNGLWQDVVTAHSVHKKWFLWSLDNTPRFSKAWILKLLNPIHYVVLLLETLQYSRFFTKRVIAISEQVKRDLISQFAFPQERIDIVYHGVNISEFTPMRGNPRSRAILDSLGIDPSAKVAIFVAHEFRRKGLSILLEALSKCRSDLHLLVVGRDSFESFESQAQSLGIASRVHAVGPQSHLHEWYGAADFFVFPTSYEAFGMVITEAMASALPVIVPREAGAAELIQHEQGGLLLDRWNDVEQLASFMTRLCQEDYRIKMSALARKCAESRTWDDAAADTLAVYKKLL